MPEDVRKQIYENINEIRDSLTNVEEIEKQ